MTTFQIDRRKLLAGAAAAASLPLLPGVPAARQPIYIADMHFHLFFFGKGPAAANPLGRNMAGGNATLVSWSLVGDVPWLKRAGGGFRQASTPDTGEAITWFSRELARIVAHAGEQGLAIAHTPEDLDKAAAGKPTVLLSVEGATLVDEKIEYLTTAHQRGIRHLQLVHFIANRIGDFQTEPPTHNGLTDFGRQVIVECNRLGILVDLAHCTDTVVRQALEISKAPMVWSHSSVQQRPVTRAAVPGWRARQLPLTLAREIAAKGGVIGLWALGADIGSGPEDYARRLRGLIDQLGIDHVGFGTDMNGIGNPALRSYKDLRRVVEILEADGLPEEQIRKIAMGNYVRVLKAAMNGAAGRA